MRYRVTEKDSWGIRDLDLVFCDKQTSQVKRKEGETFLRGALVKEDEQMQIY